jgi:hypothetical protein
MSYRKSRAELDFMKDVLGVVGELELGWHHCHDSRLCSGSPGGFPDLTILGQGGFVLAELKTEEGETTAEQDWWLYRASNSGVMVRGELWRPSDLSTGAVRAILNTIA